jgi:hypothetical protein
LTTGKTATTDLPAGVDPLEGIMRQTLQETQLPEQLLRERTK